MKNNISSVKVFGDSMMLDEVLKANEEFVKNFEPKKMSHMPQKKLAIVTCMDTRLTGFLEPAIGIGSIATCR